MAGKTQEQAQVVGVAIGKNLTAEPGEGELLIRVKLTNPIGPSRSGKTLLLASTGGNVEVELGGGDSVFMGINVYRYSTAKATRTPKEE